MARGTGKTTKLIKWDTNFGFHCGRITLFDKLARETQDEKGYQLLS
jgi:hypothetical protein